LTNLHNVPTWERCRYACKSMCHFQFLRRRCAVAQCYIQTVFTQHSAYYDKVVCTTQHGKAWNSLFLCQCEDERGTLRTWTVCFYGIVVVHMTPCHALYHRTSLHQVNWPDVHHQPDDDPDNGNLLACRAQSVVENSDDPTYRPKKRLHCTGAKLQQLIYSGHLGRVATTTFYRESSVCMMIAACPANLLHPLTHCTCGQCLVAEHSHLNFLWLADWSAARAAHSGNCSHCLSTLHHTHSHSYLDQLPSNPSLIEVYSWHLQFDFLRIVPAALRFRAASEFSRS